jgi:hypothetical protein
MAARQLAIVIVSAVLLSVAAYLLFLNVILLSDAFPNVFAP